jgi:aminopeptidase N
MGTSVRPWLTDARRCFPCWDEPAQKATFGVTLTVPADRVALSNMPETGVLPNAGDNTKTVAFQAGDYTRPLLSST